LRDRFISGSDHKRLRLFDCWVLAYLAQGVAAVQEERYGEAGIHMERTLQANPSLSSLYFIGAAALALGGRLEAGRAWADQGLAMEPGFRCRLFSELIAPKLPTGSPEVRACWAYPLSSSQKRVFPARRACFLEAETRLEKDGEVIQNWLRQNWPTRPPCNHGG
jgi:hypothetical protein